MPKGLFQVLYRLNFKLHPSFRAEKSRPTSLQKLFVALNAFIIPEMRLALVNFVITPLKIKTNYKIFYLQFLDLRKTEIVNVVTVVVTENENVVKEVVTEHVVNAVIESAVNAVTENEASVVIVNVVNAVIVEIVEIAIKIENEIVTVIATVVTEVIVEIVTEIEIVNVIVTVIVVEVVVRGVRVMIVKEDQEIKIVIVNVIGEPIVMRKSQLIKLILHKQF